MIEESEMKRHSLELTYLMAMDAGHDEANRNMRKSGRTTWNLEDWNIAVKVTNELIDATDLEKRGVK